MNWLMDVNLILASRWTTHPDHLAAKAWIASLDKFHTTAITELGFVRISLSAAYKATWDEAQETLQRLHARSGINFSGTMWTAPPPPKRVPRTPRMRTLSPWRNGTD
jgi:predicted nucleic acid-binding protein